MNSYINGLNHWDLDPDIQPILFHLLPEYYEKENKLREFGELAGGRIYALANQEPEPMLQTRDENGKYIDRVQFTPEYNNLLGELKTIIQIPFTESNWTYFFTTGYLMANPALYTPLVVSAQTAYIINKYAPELTGWLKNLLDGDMFGAVWMTEPQGGTDLGSNRTIAHLENGNWRLYGGDKFLALNAGLADLALVTAHPETSDTSSKGLALFLVPRLDDAGNLNYRVRRLMGKLSNIAASVGEVELEGSLAYMIGGSSFGIYYALETLMISRLANLAMQIGFARKAHLEVLSWVKKRILFDEPLEKKPLIRYDLTDIAVRIAGALALTFHAIFYFDTSWTAKPPYSNTYQYARLLSYLAKLRVSEHATQITHLSMEIFGGRGYIDDYTLVHMHRNALLSSAWGGTSNIQAIDALKSFQKEDVWDILMNDFIPLLDKNASTAATIARETINKTFDTLTSFSAKETEWYSKTTLRSLADSIQVALLYRLAENAGDRYAKLANLYATHFLQQKPYPSWVLTDQKVWNPSETA